MGWNIYYGRRYKPTGLDFPSNGNSITTRFYFTGAAMPNITPLTIIWRIRPRQQTGYYTTFFHGRTDGTFAGDNTYVGCHPYPDSGSGFGTTHKWEVSAEGGDLTTDDNANDTAVVKDAWYTQAAVIQNVTGVGRCAFYWNLGVNTNRIITKNLSAAAFANAAGGTNPALTFGDAPWAADNTFQNGQTWECLSGVLRGLQIYQAALSLSDVVTEAANDSIDAPQTAAGISSVWYMNQNPTPSDIADKSGAGHNPAWWNANRPTLWTG